MRPNTNDGEFEVVVTDPPWSYYGDPNKMGACGKEYETLTDEQLMEWRYPLTRDGVLFMWATCPRLDVAMECLRRHGLHYRGVAFVWVKTKADGTPIGAQGVRPSIVKPLTELVLAASYRKTGRPLKLHSESVCQTIFAARGEHSQKPEAMQYRLELMYPQARKAEFFARRLRPGWECFGNELPGAA